MDRARNRAGILEGPVFAFQARHETGFAGGDAAGRSDTGKLDRLDVLREVGALLVLAQERAREGKEEVVPGRGKWWAEKARWGGGGGNGEAIGQPLQEDDESVPTEVTDVLAARAKTKSASSGDGAGSSRLGFGDGSNNDEEGEHGGRSAKRRNMHGGGENGNGNGKSEEHGSGSRDKRRKAQLRKRMIAQSHEMPRPLWDRRVEYRQIGRDGMEEWDDVRILSPYFPLLCFVSSLSFPLAPSPLPISVKGE